ncbi:response regulator receiver [Ceratobasidium sp. AG-Ba]|nr:response regulator receiver [Ceratobasidium sp. AG-Ba]
MGEQLHTIPLLSFLDSYPEPAFILCSNGTPQTSLAFIYGNPALHSLILGGGESAVIDDSSFFNVLYSEKSLQWLASPLRSGPESLSARGKTRVIDFRPPWLPRNHAPLELELTATPIELPLTISGVQSASRSYVYIASPRKVGPQLLRAEPAKDSSQVRRAKHGQPTQTSQKSVVSDSLRPDRSTASNSSISQTALDPSKLPSRMLHTFPWEQTPLGPRSEWPQSLNTLVQFIMAKPIPTTLYWGWPELIMIYNDSYARLVGTKHPSIFGQKAALAWGDLWEVVSPVAELCRMGKSTQKVDDPLFFTSHTEFGLPQEIYHTWHWTPVWREDGSVGGALNSSVETTQRIIAERRLACVSSLMLDLSGTTTQESLMQTVLDSLSKHETDVSEPESNSPTHLSQVARDSTVAKRLFSKSQLNVTMSRIGTVGIPDHHPAAPETMTYSLNSSTLTEYSEVLTEPMAPTTEGDTSSVSQASESAPLSSSTLWPIPNVFSSSLIEIVNPVPEVLAEGLGSRAFGDVPKTAALIPIPKYQPNPGPNLPHAVLIVGLNTRRSYDADTEKWLLSIATAFSSRLLAVEKIEADAEDMQERLRLDKAKTKFFMTVSHELRTPLTLIQAPIEQISELKSLPTTISHKVNLAVRNIKRLRRLVDSILDISKLEAGKLVGRFQPVQLDRITADMASLFQSMAEKKGIKLVLEVENQEGATPPTYVDVVLWERIFCNLLSNAFKYTSRGKVTVSLTYDYTSAYLRVCDTGIGIPQNKQREVFERFQRLHDLELVHLHGGQLTVSSRSENEFPNETGSEFMVAIPLGNTHLPAGNVLDNPAPIPKSVRDLDLHEIKHWIELEAATSSVDSDEEIQSASSTLFFKPTDTILIVDDNTDMRSFIRSIFVPYLSVIEAGNGIEALDILANRDVNLILSDVLMPMMGGLELLSKLRENQKTIFIPVIFVTAVADDVGLFDGREEGIVDCITKPFRARDLLARVHLQLQIGKRRVALEKTFAERTQELRTLTDLCPVGIFRADANGGITYANPTWYQIISDPKEQDKDEWLEQVSPDSHAPALKAWRRCFLDKESSSVRLKWKNNRWTHFNIAPLLAPEGPILGAFGTITDITDLYMLEEAKIALAEERERSARARAEEAELRTQAEEERRRAQELLIDVTSHELRQPVSAILQNAEVARTNMQSLRDILGKCREDGVAYYPTSQTFEDLEEDLQALESIKQCGLSQARIASDVLSLSRIQLNALSIHPTTFDVKQQVQQVLSIFRNELGSKSISFSANFSKRTEQPALRIVSSDRDRLGQIITNLMSNAIRFTEMSAHAREIKVTLDVALDPPSDDSCVPPETDAPITQSHAQPDVPIYIYVSVQDSGPGLQKEDLALLFQRSVTLMIECQHALTYLVAFNRDPTPIMCSAAPVWGSLFAVNCVVGLMGGRIEVENVPGGQETTARYGAKFQFFIRASRPVVPVEQTVVSTATPGLGQTRTFRAPPEKSRHPTPGKSLHVLITEDNKINQNIMMRQMKRAGFTTVLASNGAEAVEAISKVSGGSSSSEFDVILMDLEMPVMDGFSATREIRQLEKAGQLKYRNFIIAVTGNARPEQVRAAQEAGVNEVVIKPYDLDELIATMMAGP